MKDKSTREILTDSIVDHKRAIAKAEKELAEGDYGCYGKDYWIFLNGEIIWDYGTRYVSVCLDFEHIENRLGNIFDDLERNSAWTDKENIAPMEGNGNSISITIDRGSDIWINMKYKEQCFCLKRAVKVHHQLGSAIAEAKRRQK